MHEAEECAAVADRRAVDASPCMRTVGVHIAMLYAVRCEAAARRLVRLEQTRSVLCVDCGEVAARAQRVGAQAADLLEIRIGEYAHLGGICNIHAEGGSLGDGAEARFAFAQRLHALAAVGDVAQGGTHPVDASVLIERGMGVDLDPGVQAIASRAARRHPARVDLAADQGLQRFQHRRTVLAVDEVGERLAHRLLCGPAGEAAPAGAHQGGVAIAVEGECDLVTGL